MSDMWLEPRERGRRKNDPTQIDFYTKSMRPRLSPYARYLIAWLSFVLVVGLLTLAFIGFSLMSAFAVTVIMVTAVTYGTITPERWRKLFK